ncbi:MAG TPA: heavy metal-binding domain-containing protein, partial [Kaistella sp.]|nr:heavy metal-binding domain-containing protein [Kaistella sp.]
MEHKHHPIPPKDRVSPSSVYYCPMECEGERVYFQQGKRCPVCNMYLVPIEEKEEFRNKPQQFSKTNLPENFKEKIGEYFCPMFCEGDKTYDSDIGCPVCHMHLELIDKQLVMSNEESKNITHHSLPITHELKADSGYYCPMFCEGDKVYDSNVGCPVCGMDLVKIPEKGEKVEDETYKILKNKFLIALAFTIPVFILSMGGMWIDFPFSNR